MSNNYETVHRSFYLSRAAMVKGGEGVHDEARERDKQTLKVLFASALAYADDYDHLILKEGGLDAKGAHKVACVETALLSIQNPLPIGDMLHPEAMNLGWVYYQRRFLELRGILPLDSIQKSRVHIASGGFLDEPFGFTLHLFPASRKFVANDTKNYLSGRSKFNRHVLRNIQFIAGRGPSLSIEPDTAARHILKQLRGYVSVMKVPMVFSTDTLWGYMNKKDPIQRDLVIVRRIEPNIVIDLREEERFWVNNMARVDALFSKSSLIALLPVMKQIIGRHSESVQDLVAFLLSRATIGKGLVYLSVGQGNSLEETGTRGALIGLAVDFLNQEHIPYELIFDRERPPLINGQGFIPDVLSDKITLVIKRSSSLNTEWIARYRKPSIWKDTNPGSMCPCGSMRAYRSCHWSERKTLSR